MTRLSPFEEFLILFSNLKSAAKGDAARVRTFIKQSPTLRSAVNRLENFLIHVDFDRRFLHGREKHRLQVPKGFSEAYEEYRVDWAPILAGIFLEELGREETVLEEQKEASENETEIPDPQHEYRFDPRFHDGSEIISWLRNIAEQRRDSSGDDVVRNTCEIAIDGFDYLTGTIGLDLPGVFRRWRKVPPIFIPSHVSSKYGQSEKGSLYALMDDAVRAFVFGAPAAAFATCRAALELVLKRHYLTPNEAQIIRNGKAWDKGLKEIIVLAEQRYTHVKKASLLSYKTVADDIMHDYARRQKFSPSDETTILNFIATLKMLIEKAPTSP